MPIISAETIEKNEWRLVLNTGYGSMEKILVTSDGLYSIYFIKNGTCINAVGKIVSVNVNKANPRNSYITFDYSEDQSNKRERIQFFKIQNIKDITPNNAYIIALEHGFVGTEEEWLKSLAGEDGKSAFELAVEAGYCGTLEEWLRTLQGESAYEIAVRLGFQGTEEEWIESLKGEKGDPGEDGKDGEDGKSAFEIAVEEGYVGTKEQWLASLVGPEGKSAYEIAVEHGYVGTEEEWLDNQQAVQKETKEEIQETSKKVDDAIKSIDGIKSQVDWLDQMEHPEVYTYGIGAAPLHDNSGVIPDDELVMEYDVQNGVSGSYGVLNIIAKGVQEHTNAQGTKGYWAGFYVVPDVGGANYFRYKLSDKENIDFDPEDGPNPLEINVDGKGHNGFTLYRGTLGRFSQYLKIRFYKDEQMLQPVGYALNLGLNWRITSKAEEESEGPYDASQG